MPEQDAVLAITAGVPDMQAVLDLVWAHMLTDASAPTGEVLQQRLPALSGTAGSFGGAYRVAKPRRTRPDDWRPSHERPPTIRSIAFAPRPGGWLVTVEDEDGAHEYVCHDGAWHTDGDVASTGAWTGPDTFTLRCAGSRRRSSGHTPARSTDLR